MRIVYSEALSTQAKGCRQRSVRLRKKAGEVPIEIGLNSIETDEGSYGSASIIDITERKQAKQAWVKS